MYAFLVPQLYQLPKRHHRRVVLMGEWVKLVSLIELFVLQSYACLTLAWDRHEFDQLLTAKEYIDNSVKNADAIL